MNLLIFAVIVILIALLLMWLIDAMPGSDKVQPFARILILLVAIIVIVQRAGFF